MVRVHGAKIRELRELRKLTGAELAESVGVDQSAISFFERGLKVPKAETLKLIADKLEVPTDDLFTTI